MFEKYDDKKNIPWWIVKCSEEIKKTFKLDLDIEDSFLLASIIHEYYIKKDTNS